MFVCSCSRSNGFHLFKDGEVASIYVSKDEAPQIVRAVTDLQKDIEMVTGIKPEIIHNFESVEDNTIIIGSIKDANIQNLKQAGHLNEADGIESLKQAFLLKDITNPSEGIKNALVVAGSDPLGTVYGIYEISERIGVSPLYWWCDVTPKKQEEVVLDNILVAPKEPSVEYRGIFINDEEAFTQWSDNTSPNKTNTHPSPQVYKKVFELLLRLKANCIWPGMMQRSSYFFEAKDEKGIPINPKNAKEYGIYVGTSHCENMARNNFDEWHHWAEEHADMYDAKGVPVFDYTINPKTIEAYWQERLDEAKDFNMIYTIGIRGVHDSPFQYAGLENPTLENRVKVLQKVIDRQREMFKETFGAEDAVPQIFVPYEETGELYNGESKDGKEKCEGLDIPDDVMMVWTEDNFGHARQLPNEKEKKHPGGNGLYYHLAYQGYPTTYDWLYTTPLTIVQEELRKVYDNNARKFWIVNVGDIKPAEMGLQFYMSIAYDIDSYPKNTTKTFLQKSAKQQFGVNTETAQDIANLITDFQQLAWSKKPEPMVPFWDWKLENNWMYQFNSLADFGDEAQRRVNQAQELEKKAKTIYDNLDESAKTPFWHLAYYPIKSISLMLQKAEYYRKNVAYAKQGRFASVNAYKTLSEQAEASIQNDLAYYKTIENGKWNGIMDPYADYNYEERIFDVANIPNNLVYDELFLEEAGKGIGSVCEGQIIGNEDVKLSFSSFEDNERFIDIFNRENNANSWKITSDVAWIDFTKNSGSVDIEERIWVSIDWEKAENGTNNGEIKVEDSKGFSKSYPVVATKYDFKPKEKSYVEGNGFVAIEAENFSAKHNGKDGAMWDVYDHYGHIGSSVFVKGGSKVETNLKENSARLDYSVYFNSTGTFYGELYRLPTLNEGKGKTCEIAIGLNNDEPQVLTGVRKKGQRRSKKLSDGSVVSWSWHRNVLMLMEKLPFEITVSEPGYHTISVYQVNTDIGIDRMVICTDKQSKLAQSRSLIGAPQSFNTISYSPVERVAVPDINKSIAKVEAYKKQEPLTNVKLNFAMYAMLDAFDFIPVNQRHVYNENKNQFGWRAKDVNQIRLHHNESSERVPFWQRDGLMGKKDSKFFVHLKEGTYNIKYYMGDARVKAEMIYNKGQNFDMSFKINGKQLMRNEKIISGVQKIDSTVVNIKEGELLELDFSGNWIINALEITKR
ncbi:glycosyl hydrolase 115 family protein [Flavobacteriaceae bacterium MHTCC 0001]